jgi:hypothetical protein
VPAVSGRTDQRKRPADHFPADLSEFKRLRPTNNVSGAM